MTIRQTHSTHTRGASRQLLPEPRPVNPGGMELPGELMRRVRRGVEQINRGQYHTFKTRQDAMRFIFNSEA